MPADDLDEAFDNHDGDDGDRVDAEEEDDEHRDVPGDVEGGEVVF